MWLVHFIIISVVPGDPISRNMSTCKWFLLYTPPLSFNLSMDLRWFTFQSFAFTSCEMGGQGNITSTTMMSLSFGLKDEANIDSKKKMWLYLKTKIAGVFSQSKYDAVTSDWSLHTCLGVLTHIRWVFSLFKAWVLYNDIASMECVLLTNPSQILFNDSDLLEWQRRLWHPEAPALSTRFTLNF